MTPNDTLIDTLGYIAGAYVLVVYLGSKLFPRAENVRANDRRLRDAA